MYSIEQYIQTTVLEYKINKIDKLKKDFKRLKQLDDLSLRYLVMV